MQLLDMGEGAGVAKLREVEVAGRRRGGSAGPKQCQQQTLERVPLGVVHFLITTISHVMDLKNKWN